MLERVRERERLYVFNLPIQQFCFLIDLTMYGTHTGVNCEYERRINAKHHFNRMLAHARARPQLMQLTPLNTHENRMIEP